ncbi:MAG TPA: hypothetical protein VMW62_05005 [Chloroflexota bacterium]|nr:hypothetical protein [Chloroflexota bacterium]
MLVPVAPAELGRAEALALLFAPTALEDGLADEAVVEVVVEVAPIAPAPRMSMNTRFWPLLTLLMKVPAMAGMPLLDEAPVADEDVAEVDAEPAALLPPFEVNAPVHWFCVNSC